VRDSRAGKIWSRELSVFFRRHLYAINVCQCLLDSGSTRRILLNIRVILNLFKSSKRTSQAFENKRHESLQVLLKRKTRLECIQKKKFVGLCTVGLTTVGYG
jgi:hypothetical protein